MESIERENGGFKAKIKQKPRFVDEAACTGCRQCEMACSVAVPDQFNADMVSRRAAYIAFPQAVPKKAVIERQGTSPCTFTCPAGIKAHGYVALIRRGEYEKAFQLVADATPLVGSLGRACYAPCESECTRASLEGPVNIRRIKRFIADTHYAKPRVAPEMPAPNGKKVAIVGSGPAGLTAAWHLARKGYEVTIFEAAPLPGGMLRLALPPYRLPGEVVDQDVANVTDIGVTIATDTRVEDLEALKAAGLRRHPGGHRHPPGHQAAGSRRGPQGSHPRHRVPPGRQARRAAGGGGQAGGRHRRWQRRHRRRPYRSAPQGRLGARSLSLESHEEMPAHPSEIEEAKAEGVTFRQLMRSAHFEGDERVRSRSRSCAACRCSTSRGGSVPKYSDEDASEPSTCDLVVVAAGMRPDSGEFGLPINPSGTIQVEQRHPADRRSRTSSPPATWWSGPSMITTAAGQGRRAAFMIDRWLQGKDLDPSEFDGRLPMVDKDGRPRQAEDLPGHSAARSRARSTMLAPGEFYPDEETLTEEEALACTSRCLDCGVCSECQRVRGRSVRPTAST